jgi:hypothetical protein
MRPFSAGATKIRPSSPKFLSFPAARPTARRTQQRLQTSSWLFGSGLIQQGNWDGRFLCLRAASYLPELRTAFSPSKPFSPPPF